MAGKLSDGSGGTFGTHYARAHQIYPLFGGPCKRPVFYKRLERVGIMLRPENIQCWAEAEGINPQGEIVTLAFINQCGKDYNTVTGEVIEDLSILRGQEGIFNGYTNANKHLPGKYRRVFFASTHCVWKGRNGTWRSAPLLEGENAVCDATKAQRAFVRYADLKRYTCSDDMKILWIKFAETGKRLLVRAKMVKTSSGEVRMLAISFQGSYMMEILGGEVNIEGDDLSGSKCLTEDLSTWAYLGGGGYERLR